LFGEREKPLFKYEVATDGSNSKRRQTSITSNTWAVTTKSIGCIYGAWDVYAKHLGFTSLEEMCQPFLYFDQEYGKIRCIGGNRCFTRGAETEFPVRQGARPANLGYTNLATSLPDVDTDELGVRRDQMNSEEPLKHVSDTVYK